MFAKLNKMCVAIGVGFVVSCAIAPASAQNSPKVVVQVVEYKAGPNWQPGTPPEKQNLGGHFKMVMENFKAGRLLANGPNT